MSIVKSSMRGLIASIADGIGTIETTEHGAVPFDATAVRFATFDELKVGDLVAFEIRFKNGRKRAFHVRPSRPPSPCMLAAGSAHHGVIDFLHPRRYGFIVSGMQRMFFHEDGVSNRCFEDLKEGQRVTFTVGEGLEGRPCAVDVAITC
jgi:cold shock CspA family protein